MLIACSAECLVCFTLTVFACIFVHLNLYNISVSLAVIKFNFSITDNLFCDQLKTGNRVLIEVT